MGKMKVYWFWNVYFKRLSKVTWIFWSDTNEYSKIQKFYTESVRLGNYEIHIKLLWLITPKGIFKILMVIEIINGKLNAIIKLRVFIFLAMIILLNLVSIRKIFIWKKLIALRKRLYNISKFFVNIGALSWNSPKYANSSTELNLKP